MGARNGLGTLRRIVVGLGVGAGLVTAMSCSDPDFRPRNCDYTVTRCRPVCDYWCDYYWGCYPRCWDQCWNECYVHDRPSSPPPTDAAAPPSTPPAADAAPSSNDTGGVLCSACTSNEDCASGALCIVRGGPPGDAGADGGASSRGFCGHACSGPPDCPQGFVCTQIGPNRQCVPSAGGCP